MSSSRTRVVDPELRDFRRKLVANFTRGRGDPPPFRIDQNCKREQKIESRARTSSSRVLATFHEDSVVAISAVKRTRGCFTAEIDIAGWSSTVSSLLMFLHMSSAISVISGSWGVQKV